MGNASTLDFDPGPPQDVPTEPPQVFVRTFLVPPGAPWIQVRAASLEVRHGSPLPLADLMHRLKRREGWSPGQPGRFAAFYIRRSDYRSPFETVVDVDGEAFRVAFGANAPDLRRLRSLVVAGALMTVMLGLVALGVGTALTARADVDGRLDVLARQAAARAREGRQIQAQLQVGVALARAEGRAGLSSDVLDDLDWLSHARTAEVQILAVHWDHGLLAVESRGEATPIAATDRDVVRSPRPIKPGVWLWGVRRRSVTAALPAGGRQP